MDGMNLGFKDGTFDFVYCNPPFMDAEKYSGADNDVADKNAEAFAGKFVALMQEEIDRTAGRGKYIIDMGDTTFAHATRKPGMAPKLYALKRIQSELGLSDNQVLTFGDMPFGNDKGLLIDSNFPYTFTNKYFDKESIEIPPFFLPGSQSSPVKSVYKAVDYLLERGV